MSKKEYIIVGDCGKYKDCLISTCGCDDYDFAIKCLEQVKLRPYNAKYTNMHISFVEYNDAWWNQNCD